MVEHSPTVSIQRMSDRVDASHMQVWRTLHSVCLYPFHMQTFQFLQPADYITQVEFCYWLLGNQQVHTQILFVDKAKFNRDEITKTCDLLILLLFNPHISMETYLQSCFFVNIWCSIIENQLIRLFVLEECSSFSNPLNWVTGSHC
jgi:hypothetical protein